MLPKFQMDSQVNIFERYNVLSLLEHMYLAVLKEFRNQGLAKGLVHCTEQMASGLARGEVVVKNPKYILIIMQMPDDVVM